MGVKCVLCEETAGKYSRKSHSSVKFDIYKCSNCGLEYTTPMPTDKELLDFYSKYNDIRGNTDIVQKNAIRNIDLICKYTNIDDKSLILDFGCGNGEFVDYYGGNCYGVELSNKNISPRIKNSIEELNIKKFHCITLFGVLEHLNDIKGIMLNINSYLQETGYIVITTVDAEALIPYFYKPPEHLTYWTKNSFKKLAKLLGLDIVYYDAYYMIQRGDVYLDRLLSRTPNDLKTIILDNVLAQFPKFVEIPTNEVFVIMQKRKLS